MAATSSRTLRLLSLLQSRRHWAGTELADRLGVSVRTLRRDVDRLRELGYPVEAQRGVDGGYALAPGAALPPLVLDDDEAVALAVGLQAAAQAPVAGMADSSVRALAKVVQVMPARLRRRVDALRTTTESAVWAGGGPVVDPAVLTSVALACRDGERIAFGYRTGGGEPADRSVEPHRLVALGRRWYLVGFDLDRADWRSFRLDRLGIRKPAGARFTPRVAPEPAALLTSIDAVFRRYRAVVLVAAPAEEVASRVPTSVAVEPVDAGHCRVFATGETAHDVAVNLLMLDRGFAVEEASAEVRTALQTISERAASG
jgi:predicted DNA-binding transcriptional regulator YafY